MRSARGRVERGRVERERARAKSCRANANSIVFLTCVHAHVRTLAMHHEAIMRGAWRSIVRREIVVHRARRVRERIEHVIALSAGASGTSVRALNDERAKSTAMYSSRRARVRRARAYARLLTCARAQVSVGDVAESNAGASSAIGCALNT